MNPLAPRISILFFFKIGLAFVEWRFYHRGWHSFFTDLNLLLNCASLGVWDPIFGLFLGDLYQTEGCQYCCCCLKFSTLSTDRAHITCIQLRGKGMTHTKKNISHLFDREENLRIKLFMVMKEGHVTDSSMHRVARAHVQSKLRVI